MYNLREKYRFFLCADNGLYCYTRLMPYQIDVLQLHMCLNLNIKLSHSIEKLRCYGQFSWDGGIEVFLKRHKDIARILILLAERLEKLRE